MKRVIYLCSLLFALCSLPLAASASFGIVDHLSLAPFIPMVIDTFVSVAMASYKFFVADGFGIIYVLIWGWLVITIGLTLFKLYIPGKWAELIGLKSDERLIKGELEPIKFTEELLKPVVRAIIAVVVLLQIQPYFITRYIVNPFLEFGEIYTMHIRDDIIQRHAGRFGSPQFDFAAQCAHISENQFMTMESCRFLTTPVAYITHANNFVITRGMDFFLRGLSGLIRIVPAIRGDAFMDLITGIILVITFVSSNFFMALLVIQGIFTLGWALIMYPFKVLMYVGKPKNPEAWIDPWDVFSDIVDALRGLVITIIAAMFIMAVNIAIVAALFNWNSGIFMDAAGGTAVSNVSGLAPESAIGFGMHSVTWLSAILTFYLMLRIFQLTREQLEKYTKNPDALYKQATGDFHAARRNVFGKKGWMNTGAKSIENTNSAIKWVRGKFWRKK
ncbi:MAG: hypothetical protein FWC83_00445 [Alphaproteobacteria bacterium]|nr:hypothetical protein [Alphaproteobacteria bacterium]